MEDPKICPIMARGWLANTHAAYTDHEDTFSINNLPKCVREKCPFYRDDVERECIYGIGVNG